MDPRCTTEHAQCQPINDKLKAVGHSHAEPRAHERHPALEDDAVRRPGAARVRRAPTSRRSSWCPTTPYVNYTDEVVFYTNTPSLVQSFMTKFDDLWTSTTEFANYANVTENPLPRRYPTYPIDPRAELPARRRAIATARSPSTRRRPSRSTCMMFRITDEQHTNAMMAAVNARCAGPADHRRRRIPQPGSAVGRLQRGQDVPRRRAGEVRRAPGHRPREGGHAVQPGHVDHRLVELDVAVHRLAARAQLLHDDSLGVPLAAGPVQPQVEQQPRATSRPSRSCRSPPDTPAYASPANRATGMPTTRRLAEVERRPVGADLRHLLRHHPQPAAPRRQPGSLDRASPRPTIAPMRCRRCSRARPTTGRSCRRRWRT